MSPEARCPGQDMRFWKPEDIITVACSQCGAEIEVCEAIGIPPVLHMGSCVDNSRLLEAATEVVLEGGLGDHLSEVPAVGVAPEWMSEKAIRLHRRSLPPAYRPRSVPLRATLAESRIHEAGIAQRSVDVGLLGGACQIAATRFQACRNCRSASNQCAWPWPCSCPRDIQIS